MRQEPTRVLVVDDDEHIRHGLTVRLSAAGFSVCAVSNGEDALLACSPMPPDVVILDVAMPGLDGYQVCDRIREHLEAPVSVIFLTGATHAGTTSCLEQLVNDAGGDYFLTKPYDAELLIRLIRRVTEDLEASAAS